MDAVQRIDSGYAIMPDCLTNLECDEIAEALAGTMSRNRAGIRHLMAIPIVAALTVSVHHSTALCSPLVRLDLHPLGLPRQVPGGLLQRLIRNLDVIHYLRRARGLGHARGGALVLHHVG
jgi:hypothetical protein